jgi:hypothetical protein
MTDPFNRAIFDPSTKKLDYLYGNPAVIMTRGFPSLSFGRFGFFLEYKIHTKSGAGCQSGKIGNL